MNILLTPRKKEISYVERDLPHSPKASRLRSVSTRLTDSAFSYVYWIQEVIEILQNSPFHNFLVLQLPPLGADDEYQNWLDTAAQMCREDSTGNNILNNFLLQSMDPELMPSKSLACENFELIKHRASKMLDPFKLLNFESSLTFDRSNILQFFRALDGMSRVYYHIFREQPSNELRVQWIMTALGNDFFHNRDIVSEVQENWANTYSDPNLLRHILNQHLYHSKH